MKAVTLTFALWVVCTFLIDNAFGWQLSAPSPHDQKKCSQQGVNISVSGWQEIGSVSSHIVMADVFAPTIRNAKAVASLILTGRARGR